MRFVFALAPFQFTQTLFRLMNWKSKDPETDKVKVTVTDETPKAYKLRDNDKPEREDWFPKSEISFDRRNVKTGDALAVIPLWLLKSKDWNK